MLDRPPEEPTPLPVISLAPDLLAGRPNWYPSAAKTVGPAQIPVLAPPTYDELPTQMLAFDKRGADDSGGSLLHFCVQDSKLRHPARAPHSYVADFASAWGILTPDFTITDQMPPWQRQMSVWWNRAVGVYYQRRGLRVVPHIRWRNAADYDHCFVGIEQGSTVAVSNYGSRRDPSLSWDFQQGLYALVERLAPDRVLVYGSTQQRAFRDLTGRTEFIAYSTDVARAHQRAA